MAIDCPEDSEPFVKCVLAKYHWDGEDDVVTGWGETEELAELHAIVQAIEFERRKGVAEAI